MSVAGIDIGEYVSCVALARKRGVDVLMNNESKRETPTCVAFGSKMRSYGGDASSGRSMNMRNTIANIRRLLGKRFDAPDVQRELPRIPFKVRVARGCRRVPKFTPSSQYHAVWYRYLPSICIF
jgi:heat shock 70kDa protein 4